MASVCTDYFGTLPPLDVVAMCARHIAEQTTLQLNDAETIFRNFDHLTALVIAASVLFGPILLLRLGALLRTIGLIAWRARRPSLPRRPRLVLDAIAEKRSGKPLTTIELASSSVAR